MSTNDNANKKERSEALALFAIAFAAISIVTAIFAVGLAARAVDRAEKGGGGGSAETTAGGGDSVRVGMIDFAFDPDDIVVAAGGSLELVNEANQPHDLHIDGGPASDLIGGGDSGTLDVSELDPGTYDIWCDVPGHKDAGMTGTITVE